MLVSPVPPSTTEESGDFGLGVGDTRECQVTRPTPLRLESFRRERPRLRTLRGTTSRAVLPKRMLKGLVSSRPRSGSIDTCRPSPREGVYDSLIFGSPSLKTLPDVVDLHSGLPRPRPGPFSPVTCLIRLGVFHKTSETLFLFSQQVLSTCGPGQRERTKNENLWKRKVPTRFLSL